MPNTRAPYLGAISTFDPFSFLLITSVHSSNVLGEHFDVWWAE